MEKAFFWALMLTVSMTACKGGKTENTEATEEQPKAVGLAIDETNFPDPAVREDLLSGQDGMDSIMTDEEIKNHWKVDVSYQGATDLKGVEKLTGLTYINVNGFQGTSIDLSNNPTIYEVYCCDSPNLTTLKLAGNPNIGTLNINNTNISSIDLTQCSKLKTLRIKGTPISALDLSGCPELELIECNEELKPNLDLSACPKAGFEE